MLTNPPTDASDTSGSPTTDPVVTTPVTTTTTTTIATASSTVKYIWAGIAALVLIAAVFVFLVK